MAKNNPNSFFCISLLCFFNPLKSAQPRNISGNIAAIVMIRFDGIIRIKKQDFTSTSTSFDSVSRNFSILAVVSTSLSSLCSFSSAMVLSRMARPRSASASRPERSASSDFKAFLFSWPSSVNLACERKVYFWTPGC